MKRRLGAGSSEIRTDAREGGGEAAGVVHSGARAVEVATKMKSGAKGGTKEGGRGAVTHVASVLATKDT